MLNVQKSNQELSVVNQDGCIVPGFVNTVTSKIINRDRGPKRVKFDEMRCSSSLSHSYECEKKVYVRGIPAILRVE